MRLKTLVNKKIKVDLFMQKASAADNSKVAESKGIVFENLKTIVDRYIYLFFSQNVSLHFRSNTMAIQ